MRVIIIRRRVDETPAFKEEEVHGEVPKAPIVMAVKENGVDMLRVICMALMNVVPLAVTVFGATFATSAGYGVGLTPCQLPLDLGGRQHRRGDPHPVRG